MQKPSANDRVTVGGADIKHVGIVDYGICNIGSVRNMLRRSGVLATIVNTPDALSNYDRIILPGVGHFKAGMENLRNGGWVEAIRHAAVEQKKPLLGICLGLQLLANHSEEGDCEGLGLLDMNVVHFDRQRLHESIVIPHMGWSEVDQACDHQLVYSSQIEKQRFYFVHSLHVSLQNDTVQPLFWCNYGYPFVAGCVRENIMGVQFHPEKSHQFGIELLTNFANI